MNKDMDTDMDLDTDINIDDMDTFTGKDMDKDIYFN
jgi:hypothetical protein